ncbi:MAG: tetratricopeptide repeat protein [Archangium sp.]
MKVDRGTLLVLGAGVLVTALFVVRRAPVAVSAYVPSRGDEVLAEVMPRVADAGSSPESAAEAAKQLIIASRKSGGDPRLLGRAQAMLAPWWNEANVPPSVRLMRATLKQSQHDFEGSLVDLDVLVKEDPSDAQAWLTRATVLQVLARYDEAMQSCGALVPLVEAETVAVCRAPLLALTGKSDEGIREVAQFNAPWALSVKGELLRWRGDEAGAQQALKLALSADPDDSYTRLLLAESLRVSGKANEVAALFAGRQLNDAELLALVLAQDGESPEREELAERVKASRARGETLHRREESRYALLVEGDVAKALELAVENWKVQREPADAQVLLEAAKAAGDEEAAAPAVEWMKKTGVVFK